MTATSRTHIFVIGTAYVVSAALYSRIPAAYCGPGCGLSLGRPLIGFLLPTATVAMVALLGVLWERDTVRDRDPHTDTLFESIIFRVVLFVLSLHTAVLIALTRGLHGDTMRVLTRAVPILLGLTFVSVGNLLPRVRPNLVIGIRTALTLRDRGAWMRTNRIAGYVLVGVGIVLIGTSLLPTLPGKGSTIGAALLAANVLVWCSWRSRYA